MKSEERNTELREPAGRFGQKIYKLKVRRSAVVVNTMSKNKKPKVQSCCLCHSHYNLGRCHVIFIFIIPLLMGLLQVDYQSKSVSPFDTHPTNMWIFFGATSIYCLALSIKLELQNHRSTYLQIIISHIVLSSGALSSLALASIFLPRLLGWLCLGSWTVMPVMLAKQFFNQIYEWLKHSTSKLLSLAHDKFHGFWGCLTVKTEHLPV